MQIRVFNLRLTNQHLQTDQEYFNDFLERVNVKKTVNEFVAGQPNYWSILVYYDSEINDSNKDHNTDKTTVYEDLTFKEKLVYQALKQWRQEIALQTNVPNFMICHNSEIISIIKFKPKSLEELYKVKGFGDIKIARFGEGILEVLRSCEV